jgi:hypothetical protein
MARKTKPDEPTHAVDDVTNTNTVPLSTLHAVTRPGRVLTARDLGIRATFDSPADAVRTLADLNLGFFESDALDAADLTDVVRDWMDGHEVAHGHGARRKVEKLGKTGDGRRMLKKNGRALVDAVLAYLVGENGNRKTRRWTAVDWPTVESFLTLVHESASEAADSKKLPRPSFPGNRPPAAGEAITLEQLAKLSPGVDPARLRRSCQILLSRELMELAKRYEAAAAKKGCMSAETRRLALHRARVCRRWAKYPTLVPGWTCGAEEDASNRLAGLEQCRWPALLRDVQELEAACTSPRAPGVREVFVHDDDIPF